MAGLPVLVGWVYLYVSEMWWIFAATLGAMILALILYMRNLAGVLTPLLVSAVSAVWAFGFVGWIGHSVEPLTMVVPVLLVARSFSHSIQVTERYYEILHSTGEPISAAENALSALLAPGTLGIITDAAALLLIGVTPIPMMEKFALFCGFWALSMFPANVLLSPVLLSVLPAPRNVNLVVSPSERTGLHTLIAMFLSQVARFSYGRRRRLTGIGLITVFAAGAIGVDRLMVGSDADGSPLLWEDAHYNQAVREINRRFAGMNTLELVFEAGDRAAVRSSDAVHAMHALQRHLESLPDAPAATFSLADYLPELNRLFSGGNPKWLPLDRGEGKLDGVIDWLLFRPGSNPKQFSHVLNLDSGHGVVRVWQKDLRPDTLERTVTQARSAIDSVGVDHGRFRIRLGSGNIALEQAVNETVAKSERIMLFLLIGVILLTCSVAYRSAMAGVVLLVPVIVSNLLLVLAMVFLGIGLSIHTLPITAIGIGIGIDYGIYLLSRLCEEARREADLGAAIDRAVGTSGMAIFFTATVVLIGLLPWYFLSELKFQADMGLLLTLVMMINMIVALIVVPYTVRLLKPRFVSG
jgi:predicted RND superfamily exporter protein